MVALGEGLAVWAVPSAAETKLNMTANAKRGRRGRNSGLNGTFALRPPGTKGTTASCGTHFPVGGAAGLRIKKQSPGTNRDFADFHRAKQITKRDADGSCLRLLRSVPVRPSSADLADLADRSAVRSAVRLDQSDRFGPADRTVRYAGRIVRSVVLAGDSFPYRLPSIVLPGVRIEAHSVC